MEQYGRSSNSTVVAVVIVVVMIIITVTLWDFFQSSFLISDTMFITTIFKLNIFFFFFFFQDNFTGVLCELCRGSKMYGPNCTDGTAYRLPRRTLRPAPMVTVPQAFHLTWKTSSAKAD